jgi:hypothetical protein
VIEPFSKDFAKLSTFTFRKALEALETSNHTQMDKRLERMLSSLWVTPCKQRSGRKIHHNQ